MLDDSAMSCETDGMGNRVSNGTSVQLAEDGDVSCADTTAQQLPVGKDESVTCILVEDADTMLNNGIVEMLGDWDYGGSSYGMTDGMESIISNGTFVQQAEDGGVTCADTTAQQLPVGKDESVTCKVGEDADTMLNSSIVDTLGDMDNTGSSYRMVEDCIGGNGDREALISSVELPGQFGLRNGSVDVGVEFSSYEVLWSSDENTCLDQKTGEEQQEKISEYLQDDGTAEGKQEEGSQKINPESLSEGSLMSKPERNNSRVEQEPEIMANGYHETIHSEHLEHEVETPADPAPCDIGEMNSIESNLVVIGLDSVDEEKETSPCPNASDDAMDSPSGQTGQLLVGTPEKQNECVGMGVEFSSYELLLSSEQNICLDQKPGEEQQEKISEYLQDDGTTEVKQEEGSHENNHRSLSEGSLKNKPEEISSRVEQEPETLANGDHETLQSEDSLKNKNNHESLSEDSLKNKPEEISSRVEQEPETMANSDHETLQNEDSLKNKNNHESLSEDSLKNKPEEISSRVEQEPETLANGDHETLRSEPPEQKVETRAEPAPSDIREMDISESNLVVVGLTSVDEEKEMCPCGFSKSLCGIEQKSPNASDAMDCPSEQTDPLLVGTPENLTVVVLGLHHGSYESPVKKKETPHHGLSKNLSVTLQNPDDLDAMKVGPIGLETNLMVLGLPANVFNESARRGKKQEKTPTISIGKKSSLRSSKDRTRVSCPRSRENLEAPRPSTKLENAKVSIEKKRGKNKTKVTEKTHDEFARMRRHLRYLLKRIQCEQNLLDAYSSEGWRGQSVEKLRPEKELERAKAEISRNKLKIRDLFQRLNMLSCEGKFPESLFDSDGLIDSEDIFCAKCGTKDSAIDNDIILCDGACDRGFHQRCLEPPLQTEEIPPDDEGWLCPACDCKVDCLDLLNDSHGTKLSVEDSWEKVFPDVAAAATAGSMHNDMMGLPSDDSEDNDYNPDGTNDDDEVEGSKSSSDESGSAKSDSSDFSSASEDLKDVCVNETETYLGLPSDDSEDDDYNPDAANVNEDDEHQSSNSEFSSSSEDLGVAMDVDETSGDHEAPLPLLEKDQDLDEIPSVSGRRHVQRLDYKKLYDETYGNACSDSSDDEEWTDIETSKKKRKGDSGAGVSASSIADTSAPVDNCAGTSKKRGRTKPIAQATNGSPSPLKKSSPNIGSTGKKQPHNKIGDFATQKLYESFKKNRYPDRDMKEKLAKEVGLTAKQVTKWFENARWSFNHHRARMEATMSAVASQCNTSHNVARDKTGTSSTDTSAPVVENHHAKSSKLGTNEGDQRKSTPRRSGRLNKIDGDQSNLESGNRGTSVEGIITDNIQTLEAQVVHQKRKRSNDHNPDETNDDDEVEASKSSSDESDSSDFSSASEDLGLDVDAVETSSDHEAPSPLLEKGQDMGKIPSMSGRRHVQRLDYKKLYDETYGNARSDSSDDEEWTDIETSKKKRKGNSRAVVSASPIADTLAPVNNNVSAVTSKKRGRAKSYAEATNDSLSPLNKSSPNIGSTGSKIGDFATQKLYESFKNNRYPDRDMKQKLAKEVGRSVKQITKWFENARQTFNHNRARMEATISAATSLSDTSLNVAFEKAGTSSADPSASVVENRSAKLSKPGTNEGDQRTATPRRSSRLNKTNNNQSNLESGKRDTSVETSEARMVLRKRKSSRH